MLPGYGGYGGAVVGDYGYGGGYGGVIGAPVSTIGSYGSYGVSAAPVSYSAPVQTLAAPVQYAAPAPVSYAAPIQTVAAAPVSYAAPVQQYAAPVQTIAAAPAYATAAPVSYGTSYAAPVSYGAAPVSYGAAPVSYGASYGAGYGGYGASYGVGYGAPAGYAGSVAPDYGVSYAAPAAASFGYGAPASYGYGAPAACSTITFGTNIELVVQMLVDLFLLTVLAKKAAKNTQAAHPKNLGGHSCFTSTTALASTCVTALALGIKVLADSRTGMHLDRLAIDETIFDELPDVEARVGHGDFTGLIGVEPDAAFATFLHACCQTFL